MRSLRRLLPMVSVALLASSSYARESAILRSGFTISHDHHEQRGRTTRLFLSSSDEEYVDVATDNIAGFETEDIPLAPPSAEPHFMGPSSPALDEIVERAARENQLDSDFVHAVIRAESGGNARALSRKGAQGLMQLMPHTAAGLGVKNSLDPNENVNAGTKYLRQLLARYKNDPVRALAAYNAGAGRVEQYQGAPPFRETHAYVASVIRDFNRRKLERDRIQKSPKKPVLVAPKNRRPDGD